MKRIENTIGSRRAAKRVLCACLAGLLVALALYAYIRAVESGSFVAWMFDQGFQRGALLVVLVVVAIAAAVALGLKGRSIGRFVFKFRWLLAMLLLAVCVVLEINGSSIGILVNLLGGDDSVLLGSSRPIRSDEYMVYTPMSLSQCTTDGGVFSYFQDSMRATETDMFCVYGQPVWDIAEIFRPFHWGYLLFGAAKGLSFFWCGRLIVLFMVSFEFAYRLITRKSWLLGLGYAFLITFSGVVQWWFSVNSLVEMLIFGQLALVWASLFLKRDSFSGRLLYSLGIAWCLGIYLLAFYPAWQIPLAYVFLALLVALLVRQIPKSNVGVRDIGFGVLIVAIVLLLAFYVFLYKSWDTVQTVFNTAYPGHRSSTGGGGLSLLFAYPLFLLAPIDPDAVSNVCESASFFTLFPLSVVLPVALLLKRKKTDPLLVCLLVVFVWLAVYCTVGFPEFLARLSLLDKTTTNRSVVAVEFVLVLLLFVTLRNVRELSRKERAVAVGLSAIVAAIGFISYCAEVGMARWAFLMLAVVGAMVCVGSDETKRMRSATCCVLIAFAIVGGSLVNPVSMGIAGYFDNEVAKAIQRESDPGDVWAVADAPIQINNVPASLGHKTLNSTNTYPQLSTWKKIDPAGEYEDVYNRYAHISIQLDERPDAVFSLVAPDHVMIQGNTDALKALGVSKVLTAERYPDDFGLVLVESVDGYNIYEVA